MAILESAVRIVLPLLSDLVYVDYVCRVIMVNFVFIDVGSVNIYTLM